MSLRHILSGLLNRWQRAFDRAARDHRTGLDGETARGEFISSFIVDDGRASRLAENGRTRTTH